ncbi:MAG: hypothetical protein EB084_04105 [Proteobacteria bacterium]|nr:hypothetical protein [Pseudomonadota bacterium]
MPSIDETVTLRPENASQPRQSARGRLTSLVLEMAETPESDAALLDALRALLDEVVALDVRFPFELAVHLQEELGRSRVAAVVLVEASNRCFGARRRLGRTIALPLSLRPLMHRALCAPADAAYALAWQVSRYGWVVPALLRATLSEVLSTGRTVVDAPRHVGDSQAAPV